MKATLLLVPLLGVSNVPLFWEPENAPSAYHLISAFLQYGQVSGRGPNDKGASFTGYLHRNTLLFL
jgi:hypothetical protein